MIEPDTIRPSQFFRRGIATPETRLLLAVLEEALNTRQRHLASTDPRSRAVLAEVEAWFRSDDAAQLCDFVAICTRLRSSRRMRTRLGLVRAGRRRRRGLSPFFASPRGGMQLRTRVAGTSRRPDVARD
jgi:hypothetical protein